MTADRFAVAVIPAKAGIHRASDAASVAIVPTKALLTGEAHHGGMRSAADWFAIAVIPAKAGSASQRRKPVIYVAPAPAGTNPRRRPDPLHRKH